MRGWIDVIDVKCKRRVKDKYGNIVYYVLQDNNGKEMNIKSSTLKLLMRCNKISVSNLRLSSNGRLIKISNDRDVDVYSKLGIMKKLKVLQGTDRVSEYKDLNGDSIYLISEDDRNHIIYIPDEVHNLNCSKDWNTIGSVVAGLAGKLTLVGGRNVDSCRHMFWNCWEIQDIDLGYFDSRKVTDMTRMFGFCESLRSVKFGNIVTKNVTDMREMFKGCYTLEYLDLSKFDTHNVVHMEYMFYNCKKLKTLDLSSFNTSKVSKMEHMFNMCNSLVDINLNSFDTHNVTNMRNMFQNCDELESLDLSRFDTSNVIDMSNMFNNCGALKSLDLSSFNTSNVMDMNNMFNGCVALKSIDLGSFDTSNVMGMSNMFQNCKSLDSLDLSNFDIGRCGMVEGMLNGLFDGCSVEWDFGKNRLVTTSSNIDG